MYNYTGVVKKVIDGDTFDIMFDLGFHIQYQTRVRLNGIDVYETTLRNNTTPEQKKLGLKAKEFCNKTLLNKKVIVKTHKDIKGKYGRYLVDILVDGNNLAELLIENGYRKP